MATSTSKSSRLCPSFIGSSGKSWVALENHARAQLSIRNQVEDVPSLKDDNFLIPRLRSDSSAMKSSESCFAAGGGWAVRPRNLSLSVLQQLHYAAELVAKPRIRVQLVERLIELERGLDRLAFMGFGRRGQG